MLAQKAISPGPAPPRKGPQLSPKLCWCTIHHRAWTPHHPRSISRTSLWVKCLHFWSLPTITLSSCNVPRRLCLRLTHLLHLRALPGSRDEEAEAVQNTHEHETLHNRLQTVHRLLWRFPRSEAPGVSDLGQFNVAAFLKGIAASAPPRTASTEYLGSPWGGFPFPLSSF